jgi:hypothetical protein
VHCERRRCAARRRRRAPSRGTQHKRVKRTLVTAATGAARYGAHAYDASALRLLAAQQALIAAPATTSRLYNEAQIATLHAWVAATSAVARGADGMQQAGLARMARVQLLLNVADDMGGLDDGGRLAQDVLAGAVDNDSVQALGAQCALPTYCE